jgi:hypothetical protein
MAKTERDKYDLFTLAVKQQLIGCEIVMKDNSSLEIEDFWIDKRTDEIHIDFTDGSESSFDLNEKFVVKIDDSYKTVSAKKKVKRKK